MYHHVGDLPEVAGKTLTDLTVSATNFEAQVNWLNSNGYTGISLEDIYLASQGKFNLPQKPVVFTFDDGYKDALTNTVPILKKYGYTGSFGIITQNPGTAKGNNVYASWNDIKNVQSLGNEIVSHTQNHFDGTNPKFTAGYIFQNLLGSIYDIRQHLGTTTNILIYPYGHYTATYVEQAKKAGFVMGITVHEGKLVDLDNLMEIPRIRVHGAESLDDFKKIMTK
jgi:peptidoglycan/xylan/chitin deacetylase (PgdA/CDA1 family)